METAIVKHFQDKPVEFLEKDGEKWLTAEQVGMALGYSEPRKSIVNIINRRQDEFEDLIAVIKLMTPGGNQETTILSRDAVNLVCMFSKKPVAKVFRRWVLQILREIQENGKAIPAKAKDNKLHYLREQRLQKKLQYQAYKNLANAPGISKEYKAILMAKACEVVTGNDCTKFLPAVEPDRARYLTATQMSKKLGVTSKRIGMMLMETHTHGSFDRGREWSLVYRDKSPYSNKEVNTYRYAPWVFERLKSYLGRQ
ncbi:MAG: Bro-N domain-containing protein [Vulcanimicrobiota bacterium]